MSGYGLVLDTSALLAYTDKDTAVHVGELIGELTGEHRLVALPALCLANALHHLAGEGDRMALLGVLVNIPSVRVQPSPALVDLTDCAEFAVGFLTPLSGCLDLAAAAALADRLCLEQADVAGRPDKVYILSAAPGVYDGLSGPDGPDLIEIPGGDDGAS